MQCTIHWTSTKSILNSYVLIRHDKTFILIRTRLANVRTVSGLMNQVDISFLIHLSLFISTLPWMWQWPVMQEKCTEKAE